jgi:hypothetical protein
MEWLNVHGLLIMLLLLLPNLFYTFAKKQSGGTYHNKTIEVMEQVGRFGSMLLMSVDLPFFTYGYWFTYGEIIYKLATGALTLGYCLIWVFYNKDTDFCKAMALALIPTAIFLLSGIFLANIPLVITGLLFGFGHCIITYYNNI